MISNQKSPARRTTIFPFLVVKNGARAVEFYTTGLGAAVIERYEGSDGKLTAELSVEGAMFCVGDEEPAFNNLSPESIGGSPVRIVLVVSDPDAVFSRALEAGATQVCPVTTEESWKIGKLVDPFGHIWEIGHPLEEA